jgi:hypothetical protein
VYNFKELLGNPDLINHNSKHIFKAEVSSYYWWVLIWFLKVTVEEIGIHKFSFQRLDETVVLYTKVWSTDEVWEIVQNGKTSNNRFLTVKLPDFFGKDDMKLIPPTFTEMKVLRIPPKTVRHAVIVERVNWGNKHNSSVVRNCTMFQDKKLTEKEHLDEFCKKFLITANKYCGDNETAKDWWNNFIKFLKDKMLDEQNSTVIFPESLYTSLLY